MSSTVACATSQHKLCSGRDDEGNRCDCPCHYLDPDAPDGEKFLPMATQRYIARYRGKRPRWLERRAAEHALALTAGGGFVILTRKGQRGIKRAVLTARAWDLMVAEAEERHRAFWERYDRGLR